MIRGDELTVRGCEFLFGSIEQSVKGDLRPPPFAGVLLYYIVLFWTIMVLHLLVIHAYT